MTHALSIVREAVAIARAQLLPSLITMIVVGGLCATVLLTTGRTVGAQRSVVQSVDAIGTRAIVIHAEPSAGLTPDVVDRIASVEDVEWVGAFSSATDVTNVAIAGGAKVPVRRLWTNDAQSLGISRAGTPPDEDAWASPRALATLGMRLPSGGIVAADGDGHAVVGRLSVPDYLSDLEPLVVLPHEASQGRDAVSRLVVIAGEPQSVAAVSAAVQSLLAADDPSAVTVSTSETLARLRGVVDGRLGDFGGGLVAGVFLLSAVLETAVLYAFVMMKRKDFGRRRALGASRSLIAGLVTTQVALLSVIGVCVGSAAALLSLVASGDPLPDAEFCVAVAVLAIAASTVAALVPATVAARREPVKELRVP
ncbi:lipoprotein ABC transporter permease [Rathayibacter rathayi]|uniref:ABC transporter permease n=1 Tax=Rathayibacter rathayi TaxID=33887 RepID=UPI000CE74D4E|nr:FtsX-like permease family protein [Rathayibacter rathayi]PPF83636.1 lipoprotein ABC transporter permease [Rathayibacter rathayi]PPG16098.1 lipoprotein ABC transporter permease [Rathayibacter rathayi]PPG47454.1 lipoprotein ABC transporter permease [Rathayibacter rathayi]PPH27368.1 lipoprotein ABC transporter permease [Rathayibacter rathayi]PPI05019.1 lipoprotein ABC transporter permease [Rathayibacter rathayi]